MLSSLWGRITGKDKGKQYPEQQASVLGRIGDYIIVYPYGLYCDLPKDTLLKELAHGVAVPVTVDRPDGLAQGEPVLFHPVSGTSIVLRNNGDVEITTTGTSKTKIIGDFEVTGDTTLGAIVTSDGNNIGGNHVHTGSPTAATGPVTPTGGPKDPIPLP